MMTQLDDNTCDSVRKLMENLIAEGLPEALSNAQTVRMLDHLRGCDACAELFDVHARLSEWKGAQREEPQREGPTLEPSAAEFAVMRAEVLDALESEGFAGPSSQTAQHGTTKRFAHPAPSGQWRPALVAAAALLMLSLGWWAGHSSASLDRSPASPELADLLTLDLADLRPYDLQDVMVRELDSSTVAISFDLATHLELERAKDDPLVTEALAQSILGGSDLGGRLNAISQTADSLPPRISEALVQAMLEDSSVAVRMQAQQRLAASLPDHASDGGIRDAFLQVLEKEESVQMRLLAIDVLAANGVASERLEEAVELGLPEPGNALKMQVGNYISRF